MSLHCSSIKNTESGYDLSAEDESLTLKQKFIFASCPFLNLERSVLQQKEELFFPIFVVPKLITSG